VNVVPEPDPPAPTPRSEAPGVRALVQSHTPPLHVQRLEPIHLDTVTPIADIARECAGKTIAAGLTVVGASALSPVLGVISALKAGMDIGQCVQNQRIDATQKAKESLAVEHCIQNGGTPVGGFLAGELTCERAPEKAAP
jgi:hypothetical protein